MMYFTDFNNPNHRSKITHPYNYDSFDIFLTSGVVNGCVYTDRLYQFDSKKYNTLCQKHFGDERQYWDARDPKAIEAFLADWNNDPSLKLIKISEHCNQATGFPTWSLEYFSQSNSQPIDQKNKTPPQKKRAITNKPTAV